MTVGFWFNDNKDVDSYKRWILSIVLVIIASVGCAVVFAVKAIPVLQVVFFNLISSNTILITIIALRACIASMFFYVNHFVRRVWVEQGGAIFAFTSIIVRFHTGNWCSNP